MEKHSLIRAIYLYLFTIIGLALLVVGSVRFIDMGLKAFVFTKAEDPEKIQRMYYYPASAATITKLEEPQTAEGLSEEERVALKNWLAEYKTWQEEEKKIDYLASQRQKNASTNLALILVGLPLYLYHWSLIKRETKNA
jgi:hypothetical protein